MLLYVKSPIKGGVTVAQHNALLVELGGVGFAPTPTSSAGALFSFIDNSDFLEVSLLTIKWKSLCGGAMI